MIEQILLEVKKFVPLTSPLAAFNAVNPLADLTYNSLDEALRELNNYCNIKGTLSLPEYNKMFIDGLIELNDLQEAVCEFVENNKIQDKAKVEDIILLFTNRDLQEKLEVAYLQTERPNSILISSIIENSDKYIDADKVRNKIIAFCNSFFDTTQAKWKIPSQAQDLFSAWLEYIFVENKTLAKITQNFSTNSEEVLSKLLTMLGVPPGLWQRYLSEIVFQLLGWCSVTKWIELHPQNPYFSKKAKLSDILAIWLYYEVNLKQKHNIAVNLEEPDKNYNALLKRSISSVLIQYKFPLNLIERLDYFTIALIWQRSFEFNYQRNLLFKLTSIGSISGNTNNTHKQNIDHKEAMIKAQAVFCIDTRSEGLRRYIEQVGNYKTYGFAGFFGLAFCLQDEEKESLTWQFPLNASSTIKLVKPKGQSSLFKDTFSAFIKLFNKLKASFLTPLLLFEIVGVWLLGHLFAKTLIPKHANKFYEFCARAKSNNEAIDIYNNATYLNSSGFNVNDLADKIALVLKAIGLTNDFAKFVLIVAHFSISENNPFSSALNCGACGGNSGAMNSIVFCKAANDEKVRQILAQRHSIHIPLDTFFVSSAHQTTTDEVIYYNIDILTKTQQEAEFEEIKQDISKASKLLLSERSLGLPNSNGINMRQFNWAQVVPELGLANNAAFIIGPRALTEGINLKRRVFLHSYEPNYDPGGEILSIILNTSAIVGNFINLQYYFSTTDPEVYGSGNKVIHNVVAGTGVMEGNFSNYKIGLPLQSVMSLNNLVHEPLRLLVIVYARKEVVNKILSSSTELNSIFKGNWAYLKIIEPNFEARNSS